MRLLYIANARMPTEKAHGLQIMHMCATFASAGMALELVVPRRKNPLTQDPFTYYNLKRTFTITTLPVLDTVRFGKIGFYLHTLLFALVAFGYALTKRMDFVYARDPLLLYLPSFFNKTAVEVHDLPEHKNRLYKFFLRRIPIIISTNQWKKREMMRAYGIAEEKIIVCPNGINLDEFTVTTPKDVLRAQLHLPQEKKIVMYTGHLYGWKGAQVLAEAAHFLRGEVLMVFVGGTDKDISRFKEQYERSDIRIVGRVPHTLIPKYLVCADVVVLPNIPSTRESRFTTSPIKLFEYMAAGIPIVASDLPSIREIIDDTMCAFCIPDDARNLAYTIRSVLENPADTAQKAKYAQHEVRQYTWERRAARIKEEMRAIAHAVI